MPSREMEDARELLEIVIPHLVHGDDGPGFYAYWIDDREEVAPGIRASVPVVAREALKSADVGLLCSAIQALAVTGDENDIPSIEPFLRHSEQHLAQDAAASVRYIRHRAKSIEQLLREVTDRQTFLTFATTLAGERARAEKIEYENPDVYIVDGALGWMNASIAAFIEAGLTHFEPAFDEKPIETPTWKDLAKFLYCGKIIE